VITRGESVIQEQVGTTIKRLRRERDLTQKDLADAINVSESTISGWERGTRAPGYDDLDRLAHFFGIGVNAFFGAQIGADIRFEPHFLTVRYQPMAHRNHMVTNILFLVVVGSSFVGSFVLTEAMTIVFSFGLFAFLLVYGFQEIAEFGNRHRIINYPHYETLVFVHPDPPETIRRFQVRVTVLLSANFLIWAGLLVYGFIYMLKLYVRDDVTPFFSIMLLLGSTLFTYLFVMEWTLGRREKEIDYFQANSNFYRVRFLILMIYAVVIHIVLMGSILFFGHDNVSFGLRIGVPFLILAHLGLSVAIRSMNVGFYRKYALYSKNPKTGQTTRLS
jgi:transcriptional regulator with XRE-family HTH domain